MVPDGLGTGTLLAMVGNKATTNCQYFLLKSWNSSNKPAFSTLAGLATADTGALLGVDILVGAPNQLFGQETTCPSIVAVTI